MNYISVTKAEEITLDGITVEMDRHNSGLASLRLTDASGHVLKVAIESYSMQAFIPAPPKMVKRYRVEGEVLGLKVCEDFADRYDADSRARTLQARADADDAEINVTEIEVPE